MKPEPINFSIFELIQKDNYPKASELARIIQSGHYEDGNSTYVVAAEAINDCVWIEFQYGTSYPRPDQVIDKQKRMKVDNPRSDQQVEPTKQLFCLYVENHGNLYVSDSRKKGFLEQFLNRLHDKKNFIIKRVIVDPEEFLSKLKTVDRMIIAAKTDLITQTSYLFRPTQDIFGYGAPERYEIKADYRINMNDIVRKKFQEFYEEAKTGRVSKFICVGKDDQGIETIFNADNLTSKISIDVTRQQTGLINEEEAKKKIMDAIQAIKVS